MSSNIYPPSTGCLADNSHTRGQRLQAMMCGYAELSHQEFLADAKTRSRQKRDGRSALSGAPRRRH
jgi:hypothetical protein